MISDGCNSKLGARPVVRQLCNRLRFGIPTRIPSVPESGRGDDRLPGSRAAVSTWETPLAPPVVWAVWREATEKSGRSGESHYSGCGRRRTMTVWKSDACCLGVWALLFQPTTICCRETTDHGGVTTFMTPRRWALRRLGKDGGGQYGGGTTRFQFSRNGIPASKSSSCFD